MNIMEQNVGQYIIDYSTYVATVYMYVIIIATHLGKANFCWSYLAAFVSVSNDVKRMHLNCPQTFLFVWFLLPLILPY